VGSTEELSEAAAADVVASALALARAFSAGATMWCVAPQWPAHGRHVAVEFVHPVVVGTRALPAVCVDDPDLEAALRSVVRPGDVVTAVADAECAEVAPLLRRAAAWGLGTVWIGSGARPPAGAADHVLWVDDDDGLAPYDGRVTLRYHVLWEMTHVCFEHPGLLVERATECGDEGCITCSDEGVLGEIVTVGGGTEARVRTAKGVEVIDVALVGDVGPGDLVLVHAGTALLVVDRDEPPVGRPEASS
jgi:hydrogenase maturation factor